MLQINLLPPERRRLRRTPIYAMVPLVSGVALITGSLALSVFFYLQKIALDRERKTVEKELNEVRLEARRYDALERQLDAIRKQMAEIDQVARREIAWSEVIRDLTDVISKNPGIWVEEINILDSNRAESVSRRFQKDRTRRSVGYGIELKVNAAPVAVEENGETRWVADPARLFNFRRDLKTHPGIRERFPNVWPLSPEWKKKTSTKSKEGFYLQTSVFLLPEG